MDRTLKEIRDGKYLHEPPKRNKIDNISSLFEQHPKRLDIE